MQTIWFFIRFYRYKNIELNSVATVRLNNPFSKTSSNSGFYTGLSDDRCLPQLEKIVGSVSVIRNLTKHDIFRFPLFFQTVADTCGRAVHHWSRDVFIGVHEINDFCRTDLIVPHAANRGRFQIVNKVNLLSGTFQMGREARTRTEEVNEAID